MPLPLIVGLIAAVGAGGLGVAAHSVAKDNNEEAQRIVRQARREYDECKDNFERAKSSAEAALEKYGRTKIQVMETTWPKFSAVYSRLPRKEIDKLKSSGNNLCIDIVGFNSMCRLEETYKTAFAGGAAGAAVGTFAAIAASGMLPLTGAVVSTAGTAVLAGEFGVAASLIGSSTSLAVTCTPLGAIVAPAILVSGFAAGIKSEDNLEKAKEQCAEAQQACEELRLNETILNSIAQKADMFDSLLTNVNKYFYAATDKLESAMSQRPEWQHGKEINYAKLSDENIALLATTSALAKAFQKIMETSLIDGNKIADEADKTYDAVSNCLPKLVKDCKQVVSAVKQSEVSLLPKQPKNVTKPTATAANQSKSERVLALISEKGFVTRTMLEEELTISSAAALSLLRKMIVEGTITCQSSGGNTKYVQM